MLYVCGSNGNGQLGLGHTEDIDKWTPVETPPLSPNCQILSGGNHTIIVDNGRAYGTYNCKFMEIKHPKNMRWRTGSAGYAFFCLVDEQNCIYTCTSKDSISLLDSLEMTKLEFHLPDKITEIKSGMSHTVFRTHNGDLYAWGASRKGQCSVKADIVLTPIKLPFNVQYNQFACGRDFTAVLDITTQKVHILGNNRNFGSSEHALPKLTTTIKSSWTCLLFLPPAKIIGNNWQNLCEIPPVKFTKIALGSEHGLLVNDQTVHTWGWKEHGNCPDPATFEGEIEVFGGCATSFVFTY